MKKTSNTVSIVTNLAKPIADELSLTIWDVQFVKEGSVWIVRVIIDKDGGISVEDCESLSRPLDKKLDEVDPIEQSYCLEVCSAGLERELTQPWHYEKMAGETVIVKLFRPYNGEREFIGKLICCENDTVSIETSGDKYQFKLSEVTYVRQYFDFSKIG